MDSFKKKVFIIDDDLSILSMLSKAIKSEGYDFKTFTIPEEAIADIVEYVPDLIFLDLNFRTSELTGYDVLKHRMDDKLFSSIPVVVISSQSEAKSIQKAMAYKANDFLPKPLNLFTIKHKLEKFLEHNQSQVLSFEKQDYMIKGEIEGKLTQICEVAVEVELPVKIHEAKIFNIRSDFFNSMGMMNCKFETLIESRTVKLGHYKNKLKIQGLRDNITKSIRQYVNKDE